MREFHLLLAVRSWSYTLNQSYHRHSGSYAADRRLFLKCFWDSDAEFCINGQQFHKSVVVEVKIGKPIKFFEAKDLELAGGHTPIKSGIGGVRYFPKTRNRDTAAEVNGFLSAILLVSEDIFSELAKYREDLRRFHLSVMGDNVDLNWDGEPSWTYQNADEDSLLIIGFSYTVEPTEGKPCLSSDSMRRTGEPG